MNGSFTRRTPPLHTSDLRWASHDDAPQVSRRDARDRGEHRRSKSRRVPRSLRLPSTWSRHESRRGNPVNGEANAGHDISARVFVRRSLAFATAALRSSVGDGYGTLTAPVAIKLRAPVRLGALGTDIELHDAIVAELRAPIETGNGTVLVTWQLPAGGVFPRFAGHMWAQADTAEKSWLCLDGEYQRHKATMRVAERGEFLIGHRIAVATAKTLLDVIAAHIEKKAHA